MVKILGIGDWILVWRLWIGLIGFALILTACDAPFSFATPSAPPPPNPALMELDPRVLSAQLTVTDSLAQASAQLAAEVNVPVDGVRVLMRTERCLSCAETTSNRDSNALAELTVEEASPLLESGNHFWLSIPPLACLYLFDRQQIHPQGCRSS